MYQVFANFIWLQLGGYISRVDESNLNYFMCKIHRRDNVKGETFSRLVGDEHGSWDASNPNC